MLTRWLERNGGSGESRVFTIWAWAALAKREDLVEMAESTRAARALAVRKTIVGKKAHGRR